MKKLVLFYFVMMVLLISCKKEAESESENYIPFIKKIEGIWIVESSYDKSNGVTTTYPNNLNSSSFTFTDTSILYLKTPCNTGLGYFTHSENGAISTRNIVNTNIVCSTTEGNDWDGAIKNSANYAYHLKLNGDKLTIVSHSQSVKNIILKRE